MTRDASRPRCTDLWWTSADGVKLHAHDFAGDPARPPVLCLPGLTRNARDYHALAARLSPAWRVIAVDFRGRGESKPAPDPMSYVPPTYAADVAALLAQEGIGRFVSVGTSLGGLVTMLLALQLPGRVAAAVLNDVGPRIEPGGLSRIRGYVGRPSVWPTWMHAARATQEANADVYPDWSITDWLAMAKRLYRVNSSGRIVLDYDLKIAEPFKTAGDGPAPEPWEMIEGLHDVPTLIVRGERSDVLSVATAERMIAVLGRAELVTVRGVGHAPTLSEPVALDAIERLLARAEEPAST